LVGEADKVSRWGHSLNAGARYLETMETVETGNVFLQANRINRTGMSSHDPDNLIRRFATLAKRHIITDVEAVYLRGSAARGDWVSGLSDVDFFIVAPDRVLEDTRARELLHRKLDFMRGEIIARWPRENPSMHVVSLSSISSNTEASYLTRLDAQLLLGSDVLEGVPRPSQSNLMRFGAVELDRFSNYWSKRARTGYREENLLAGAAYEEYVVLKLAQMALLAKGVSKTRKEEISESFAVEFPDPRLAGIVDTAEQLRRAWYDPPKKPMSSFVRDAALFPKALRRRVLSKD
jgi:predicted nucleotidyltransferase